MKIIKHSTRPTYSDIDQEIKKVKNQNLVAVLSFFKVI